MAATPARTFRRDYHRPARPVQFCAGQALFRADVPHGGATP